MNKLKHNAYTGLQRLIGLKRSFVATTTLLVPLMTAAFVTTAVPAPVQADTQTIICQRIGVSIGGDDCRSADDSTVQGLTLKVTNVLTFFIGAISVIVIVIAGIMYTSSSGSPDRTKRAREAIIYALIGIAAAFFAQLIVRFVLSSV